MEKRYRATWAASALDAIRQVQLNGDATFAPVSKYWLRPELKHLLVRDANGRVITGARHWRNAFFRVGDIEDHIRENRKTKLSDTMAGVLTDGSEFFPFELLFLMPVRNLIEGRNDGLLDIDLYSSIGALRHRKVSVLKGFRDEIGSKIS